MTLTAQVLFGRQERQRQSFFFFQPTKSKENIDDLLVVVSGRFIMQ